MPRNSDGTVTLKTTGKTARKGGSASAVRRSALALPVPSSARIVRRTPLGKAVKDSDRI